MIRLLLSAFIGVALVLQASADYDEIGLWQDHDWELGILQTMEVGTEVDFCMNAGLKSVIGLPPGLTFHAGASCYGGICTMCGDFMMGAPTQAGTYQITFSDWQNRKTVLTVTVKGKSGFGVEIPSQWFKARTLKGIFGNCCSSAPDGTCELKCGKVNAKGVAKVTLTVIPFVGKKISYGSTNVQFDDDGCAFADFKGRFSVTIRDDDTFEGESVADDETFECEQTYIYSRELGGAISATELIFSADYPGIPIGEDMEILDFLLPDNVHVKVSNSTKFVLSNSVSVNYTKFVSPEEGTYYSIVLPDCAECSNYSGLKLSYASKTGLFKGSYVVYVSNESFIDPGIKPTLRKYKVAVNGVFADNVGMGMASIKIGRETYSWPVVIEPAEWYEYSLDEF